MKCPECGDRLMIRETCGNSAEGPNTDSPSRVAMLAKASEVWDWTPDYIIRRRACRGCDWTTRTIEVILNDLKESYDDISG